MRIVVAAVLISACGGPAQNLYPAGSDKDDGHGVLAQASARFMRHEPGTEEDLFTLSSQRRRDRSDDDDEGGAYGGAAYGGAGYGNFVVPQWQYQPAVRVPKYTPVANLAGVIEGAITWKGPIPKQTTACGTIDGARVGADRGVADVLVYIEHVKQGRMPPSERPVAVGGAVVKKGCALVPAVQIVTPLPAAFAIHGDAKPAKLRVTTPSKTHAVELEEGGRMALQAQAGVTRIEAEDGSLAPAWLVALDAPYYAITDDHGRFRLDELAPGTYDVTIWHAPLAMGAPIVVHRNIRVDATKPARLDVVLER
jgi:hypothetical protein